MDRSEFIKGLRSGICLSDKERAAIMYEILLRCSWKTECVVIMEELAELQQQISKQIRNEGDYLALLEEMADVEICMQYLMFIFGVDAKEVVKAMDVKLMRAKKRSEKDD